MASPHTTQRPRNRHKPWLAIVLLCVTFRAIIPVGFMPGGDSWFTLCYGNAGSAQLLALAQQHNGHGGHHGHHMSGEPDSGQQHTEHSYCLFASVSLNATNATEAPLVPPLATADKPVFPLRSSPANPPYSLQFARAPPAPFSYLV